MIGLQLWADVFQIAQRRQAVFVSGNFENQQPKHETNYS